MIKAVEYKVLDLRGNQYLHLVLNTIIYLMKDDIFIINKKHERYIDKKYADYLEKLGDVEMDRLIDNTYQIKRKLVDKPKERHPYYKPKPEDPIKDFAKNRSMESVARKKRKNGGW